MVGLFWIFVVPIKFSLCMAKFNKNLDKTIMNLEVEFSKGVRNFENFNS